MADEKEHEDKDAHKSDGEKPETKDDAHKLSKKNKRITIIAAIVGAIVAVYFYMKSKGSSSSASNAASTPSTLTNPITGGGGSTTSTGPTGWGGGVTYPNGPDPLSPSTTPAGTPVPTAVAPTTPTPNPVTILIGLVNPPSQPQAQAQAKPPPARTLTQSPKPVVTKPLVLTGQTSHITGSTHPNGTPTTEHITVTQTAKVPNSPKVSTTVGRATAITAPNSIPVLTNIHSWTAPSRQAPTGHNVGSRPTPRASTPTPHVSPVPNYSAQPKNAHQASQMAKAGWRG